MLIIDISFLWKFIFGTMSLIMTGAIILNSREIGFRKKFLGVPSMIALLFIVAVSAGMINMIPNLGFGNMKISLGLLWYGLYMTIVIPFMIGVFIAVSEYVWTNIFKQALSPIFERLFSR